MTRRILLAPLVFLGCTQPSTSTPPVDPEPFDETCSSIYAQNVLPELYVEISDEEWAKLDQEFRDVVNQPLGMEDKPYHPIVFHAKIGDEVTPPITDALIRLKGSSSWRQTIDLDANPKMQFVIAFNEVDPDGRWKGVRKLELDMPRTDHTFLRQRVALSFLREAGLEAPCANSARLYINGEYYGLYTNLERMDKEFIQRNWPESDDGDWWKGGREPRTNEESLDWTRIDALWSAQSFADMEALVDLEASTYEWAGEAMIGHADGFYNGRANWFLYDHPDRGFIWVANDIDTALDGDFLRPDASPIFPDCILRWERDWHHYILAMNDPAGVEMYARALADVRARYDAGDMQRRIDAWSAQIEASAAEDPRRPFSMDQHEGAVARMRDYASARAAFMDDWLACKDGGGSDGDGDGYLLCEECNDNNPSQHPAATEVCNGIDDNCDGRTDNIDGVSVCE